MSVLALLLAGAIGLAPDTTPPVLSLPEPGLDDAAAYRGYLTRVYRDAAGDAFQVSLDRRMGRVVNVWADAADESAGFTVRDSAGRAAPLAWASSGAETLRGGRNRAVAYRLSLGPGPVRIGLVLLGSMRVERDFHYQDRDTLPLDAPAFDQRELDSLLADLGRLSGEEQRRELALLGVGRIETLAERLEPRVTRTADAGGWTVKFEQVSFDGRSHLLLELSGDSGTTATLAGRTVEIRSGAGAPVTIGVRVTTDARALTPVPRAEMFNDDFRRFYDAVRADTAHPLRFRRLEREVRGAELLTYREKMMAGLPNFATYFGRDMLMTDLLMRPVWAPEMPELVIASALERLDPDGDVSHEEALGGQAIREHAGLYVRAMAAWRARREADDTAGARRALEEARRALQEIGTTRQNYLMVDDDFQLPVVAADYLADPRVPAARKRAFLLTGDRLARLLLNLAFVARRAAPYADTAVATNLVSFPRVGGTWLSASWRDSRVGYAGGRFAMDVNAIWVPAALEGIDTILAVLPRLGLPAQAVAGAAALREEPLATWWRDRASLERAIAAWRGAERWFEVTLSGTEAWRRITARLDSFPAAQRDYWAAVLKQAEPLPATVRFLALALDSAGRPIPVMNTDPAMALVVDHPSPERALGLVRPSVTPYPVGLFAPALGPLTANDAYATPEVWSAFLRDPYHSPSVVWGRDVNILLVGLARTILAAPPGADVRRLREAFERTADADRQSGMGFAELWSYGVTGDTLHAERYGSSSDVQLWSLTDIAVQFLEARLAAARP